MTRQKPSQMTKLECVNFEILRRDTPAAIWTTLCIVHISGSLRARIEKTDGWRRIALQFLLALHKSNVVRILECKLLNIWYGWLRFNPQKTVRQLELVPSNSLKGRLSRVETRFNTFRKGVRFLLLLLAFIVIAGIANDLLFDVLLTIERTLLEASLLHPDSARFFLVGGIELYMLLIIVCLSLAIIFYARLVVNVIAGFREYHQIVRRIKKLAQTTKRR